jgi:hypothetical protein
MACQRASWAQSLGNGIIVPSGNTPPGFTPHPGRMHRIASLLRSSARLLAAVVVGGAASRAVEYMSRRRREERQAGRRSRRVLPSLYQVHPQASVAQRRSLGVRTVPIDRVVGTLRNPSQNTVDFLPLPELRGRNWVGRWQRIRRAMDNLDVLPPIELVKVGDEYWVADGHNRVAAARRLGAVAIDADVTELVIPGIESATNTRSVSATLFGSEELRQAASGHYSPTAERWDRADQLSRRDLLRERELGPGDNRDEDEDEDEA